MKLNDWIDKYINDEHTREVFGKWAEKIAQDKGKEEGLEQGIEKVAEQMLLKNIDLKTISECTNLSIDEIKSLQHNLTK